MARRRQADDGIDMNAMMQLLIAQQQLQANAVEAQKSREFTAQQTAAQQAFLAQQAAQERAGTLEMSRAQLEAAAVEGQLSRDAARRMLQAQIAGNIGLEQMRAESLLNAEKLRASLNLALNNNTAAQNAYAATMSAAVAALSGDTDPLAVKTALDDALGISGRTEAIRTAAAQTASAFFSGKNFQDGLQELVNAQTAIQNQQRQYLQLSATASNMGVTLAGRIMKRLEGSSGKHSMDFFGLGGGDVSLMPDTDKVFNEALNEMNYGHEVEFLTTASQADNPTKIAAAIAGRSTKASGSQHPFVMSQMLRGAAETLEKMDSNDATWQAIGSFDKPADRMAAVATIRQKLLAKLNGAATLYATLPGGNALQEISEASGQLKNVLTGTPENPVNLPALQQLVKSGAVLGAGGAPQFMSLVQAVDGAEPTMPYRTLEGAVATTQPVVMSTQQHLQKALRAFDAPGQTGLTEQQLGTLDKLKNMEADINAVQGSMTERIVRASDQYNRARRVLVYRLSAAALESTMKRIEAQNGGMAPNEQDIMAGFLEQTGNILKDAEALQAPNVIGELNATRERINAIMAAAAADSRTKTAVYEAEKKHYDSALVQQSSAAEQLAPQASPRGAQPAKQPGAPSPGLPATQPAAPRGTPAAAPVTPAPPLTAAPPTPPEPTITWNRSRSLGWGLNGEPAPSLSGNYVIYGNNVIPALDEHGPVPPSTLMRAMQAVDAARRQKRAGLTAKPLLPGNDLQAMMTVQAVAHGAPRHVAPSYSGLSGPSYGPSSGGAA